ncbi:hypothetical protein GIB67_008855 [Kingdonia uniflora]|uniref:Serine aminopeptidase S33 domain-containing protein n=1 Tax=Kingdonia uniflora TaxID=39325 RepID=A0A7J7LVG1_9MAGN|nr:hypothetical protein GIB67_008855 [Kingdonia uniflora]
MMSRCLSQQIKNLDARIDERFERFDQFDRFIDAFTAGTLYVPPLQPALLRPTTNLQSVTAKSEKSTLKNGLSADDVNSFATLGDDFLKAPVTEAPNGVQGSLLRFSLGHGGSDGLHAYVHSLDDAVNDLKEFLQKVLRENSGLPCFCFGHSTGAAIILKTILDPRFETLIEGVALTSPAIGVQPSHPIFGMLAPIFSFLLPRYQFGAANKMGMPVSRDPEALLAKYSDPLVYTGSIRVRTGSEILRISSYLLHHLSRISVPFLVLHGTADTVTDPLASLKLYEEAASTEKSIKLYEGFLHDLLFEPEREAIAAHIIEWLNSRVNG